MSLAPILTQPRIEIADLPTATDIETALYMGAREAYEGGPEPIGLPTVGSSSCKRYRASLTYQLGMLSGSEGFPVSPDRVLVNVPVLTLAEIRSFAFAEQTARNGMQSDQYQTLPYGVEQFALLSDPRMGPYFDLFSSILRESDEVLAAPRQTPEFDAEKAVAALKSAEVEVVNPQPEDEGVRLVNGRFSGPVTVDQLVAADIPIFVSDAELRSGGHGVDIMLKSLLAAGSIPIFYGQGNREPIVFASDRDDAIKAGRGPSVPVIGGAAREATYGAEKDAGPEGWVRSYLAVDDIFRAAYNLGYCTPELRRLLSRQPKQKQLLKKLDARQGELDAYAGEQFVGVNDPMELGRTQLLYLYNRLCAGFLSQSMRPGFVFSKEVFWQKYSKGYENRMLLIVLIGIRLGRLDRKTAKT